MKDLPEIRVLRETHSNISGNKKYFFFTLGIGRQQGGTKEPAVYQIYMDFAASWKKTKEELNGVLGFKLSENLQNFNKSGLR